MSIFLGDITLPQHRTIKPKKLETSSLNASLDGKITKDIRNIKNEWVLTFEQISLAEYNSIIGEYELESARRFRIAEPNYYYGWVNVIIKEPEIDIMGGPYTRYNITLTLIEVE